MENTTTDSTTTSAEQFDSQEFFKKHLIRSENGALEVQGDDLSPVELALCETEKRRRGSQAASSREKARADRGELELTKVKDNIRGVQIAEPVDPALKYSDPDAYIAQTLAAQTTDPYQEAFDTASKQASQEASQMTVDSVLLTHNQSHPDRQVTLDMLEMDLPPRLVSEFETGKISPADFLNQAADILYRPTEIGNTVIPNVPDLGEVGGQTTPTDDGSNDKLMENYSTAIF